MDGATDRLAREIVQTVVAVMAERDLDVDAETLGEILVVVRERLTSWSREVPASPPPVAR